MMQASSQSRRNAVNDRYGGAHTHLQVDGHVLERIPPALGISPVFESNERAQDVQSLVI
jgi:hypothetical protein